MDSGFSSYFRPPPSLVSSESNNSEISMNPENSQSTEDLADSSADFDFTSEANSQSFEFFSRTVRSPRGSAMPSLFDMFGDQKSPKKSTAPAPSLFDPPTDEEIEFDLVADDDEPKKSKKLLSSSSSSSSGSSGSGSASGLTDDAAMVEFQAMLYKDQKFAKSSILESEALIIPHLHFQSDHGPWDSTRPKLGITNYVGIIPWDIPVHFEDGQQIDSFAFLYDEDGNDLRVSSSESSMRVHQRRASALQIQALLANQEKEKEIRFKADRLVEETAADVDKEQFETEIKSSPNQGSRSIAIPGDNELQIAIVENDEEIDAGFSSASDRESETEEVESSRRKSNRVDSDNENDHENDSELDDPVSKSTSRHSGSGSDSKKKFRSDSGSQSNSQSGRGTPSNSTTPAESNSRRHSTGGARLPGLSSNIPGSSSSSSNSQFSSIAQNPPTNGSGKIAKLKVDKNEKKTGRSTPLSQGRRTVESPASQSRNSRQSLSPITTPKSGSSRSSSGVARPPLPVSPPFADSISEKDDYSRCSTPDLVARIKELEIRLLDSDKESDRANGESEKKSNNSQIQKLMGELIHRMSSSSSEGAPDGNHENKMRWIEQMMRTRAAPKKVIKTKIRANDAKKYKTLDPSILNAMLAGEQSPTNVKLKQISIPTAAPAANPLSPLSPRSGVKRTPKPAASAHQRTGSYSGSTHAPPVKRAGSSDHVSPSLSPKSESNSAHKSSRGSAASRSAAPVLPPIGQKLPKH